MNQGQDHSIEYMKMLVGAIEIECVNLWMWNLVNVYLLAMESLDPLSVFRAVLLKF